MTNTKKFENEHQGEVAEGSQEELSHDVAQREARKRTTRGIICALVGGTCWGISGTCASYLFDSFGVSSLWLTCYRQLCAGIMFLIFAAITDRTHLKALWTTPRDLLIVAFFAVFGLAFNQLAYLRAIQLTNAGTATVLQCLALVFVMIYSCLSARRPPRKREFAGLILAISGTYFIATGGNPSTLLLPVDGFIAGICAALGSACLSIIPMRILPKYGTPIVTGSGMLVAGILLSMIERPWETPFVFDVAGWIVFAILIVVGSFLAYFLYMQGVKDIGSMRASLLGTSEPISATVTSALLLGVAFAPTDILGFALIIAMIFLTA